MHHIILSHENEKLIYMQMMDTYKRRTARQSWDEQSMQRAIEAVHNGEVGWLRASKQFRVPEETLRKREEKMLLVLARDWTVSTQHSMLCYKKSWCSI
jgi:hypothetical protein